MNMLKAKHTGQQRIIHCFPLGKETAQNHDSFTMSFLTFGQETLNEKKVKVLLVPSSGPTILNLLLAPPWSFLGTELALSEKRPVGDGRGVRGGVGSIVFRLQRFFSCLLVE